MTNVNLNFTLSFCSENYFNQLINLHVKLLH